jgi:Protein kinase domain/zinc-ribbon domain
MFCISCGTEVKTTARFCSRCGQAVGGDADATVLGDENLLDASLETILPDHPATPRRTPSAAPSTPLRPRSNPSINPLLTSDPIGGGRFTPGAIIAERYRIVALLGRGGMGEVYRAEDLTLSQVVAIKFLPVAISQDPSVLPRFHSEVRIARQISHPNVCRVFDIGDSEGIPFLTMEYVDGEDLSSLVRRIGRLPQDKAAEVSRQICAGLAAAHDRGIVHRDLKPANVMLDGAGKVRITDFGLAGIAANIQGAEVRAGTPAYMAPEQLSGKEVTTRSDLYSLGLVMYEILTGKRAYDANTMPELIKAREDGSVTNPSTLVKDLDPLLERVILRCLDKDPAKRPATALQVSAALPGGDPLAAALAAGETPSPEMVAASGETEAVRPRVALALLAAVFALLVIITYLGIRENGLKTIQLQNSTEVMTHQAQEIAANLGYPKLPKDLASGYSYDNAFLEYLETQKKSGSDWTRIFGERAPLLYFWYRQSPEDLFPSGFSSPSLTPGVVTFSDPPPTFSGMVSMRLDPSGRLLYFQAIPPEKDDHAPATAAQAPDWQPLFSAAGLNMADFHAATPSWNSLAASDTRAAWDGTWPGTKRPLHVEAASFRDNFVYFMLSGPWTTPSRMPAVEQNSSQKASNLFGVFFVTLLVAGAIWLAYRNYSRGKGDRRGAWRIAAAAFLLGILLFLLKAHLSFTDDALFLLLLAASTALFIAAFLWTLYIALEPYVRSKWPQTIVSWSRLLSGKIRDPLVGRDILMGTLLGLIWVLVYFAGYLFDIRVGERPLLASPEMLAGTRVAISMWFGNILGGLIGVLIFFFVLVFLRVLVRNAWVSAILFVILFALPKILASSHRLIDGPIWILIYMIAAFAVVRFGLIVLATATFTANVLLNVPYTLDTSDWYAPASILIVVSFVGLAVWGFFAALAGQKIFKEELFD